MSRNFDAALREAVISASVAETWDEAVLEWEVTDCEEDPSKSHSCLCGKEDLRYLYTIANKETGETLFPIGSSCIEKFGRSDLNESVDIWKQVIRLLKEAERLGRGEMVALDSGFFSRKLLAHFRDEGVLSTIPQEEGWFSDYEFMIKMFNAHYWDEEDVRDITQIMKDHIYPYLRKGWRQLHPKKQ